MSGINDRIAEAAQKIHDKYPRILRECNDQTPLPWLHAVIQEAMPRCETCALWEPQDPRVGHCGLREEQSAKLWPSAYDALVTVKDFGCVQWKAKT